MSTGDVVGLACIALLAIVGWTYVFRWVAGIRRMERENREE